MNEEQFDYCKKEANKLAKILMDKDVSKVFKDGDNANYVLHTLVILCAGSLSLLGKLVNIEFEILVNEFAKLMLSLEISRKEKKKSVY